MPLAATETLRALKNHVVFRQSLRETEAEMKSEGCTCIVA